MKKQIISKHMKVTPAMAELIEKSIEELDVKFIHNRDTAKVTTTLKLERGLHICEVVVFLPKTTVRKESSTQDMYESIKDSFSKISDELKQRKEKNKDKKHHLEKQIEEDEDIEE